MNQLKRSSSKTTGKSKPRGIDINDTHTTISQPLPNNLLAIFKVRFDVHRGNELVWQYPPDIDLQGVEYQLICSGLHLVEKDIIYFSRHNGVGVGVFENKPSQQDRGATMQAIGVLIALPSTGVHPGPLDLWPHVSFLERHPEADELEDYYLSHKYQPIAKHQMHYYITPVQLNTRYFQPFESVPYALTYYVESSISPFSSERLQQQQQWHRQDPSRSFSDMVLRLGPAIFGLWKAILLKQRILMMGVPPMEQLCYYVYNAYLMDQWQSPTTPHTQAHMVLKFNVGINDINDLAIPSYIACTSDAIFDLKKDMYDVLFDFSHGQATTNTTVNAADHVRYNLLMHLFPTPPPNTSRPSTWRYYRYEWAAWCEAHTRTSPPPPPPPLAPINEELVIPSTVPLTTTQQQLLGDPIHLNDPKNVTYDALPDQLLVWGNAPSMIPDTLNNTLLGFFHVLTLQLITSLQTLVQDQDDVVLGIHDMVRLGLDPWDDRDLVRQLGLMYFDKHIEVAACGMPCCGGGPIQL